MSPNERNAEDSLKGSEERLKTLVAAAFEGIVINISGNIVEVNKAMLDMTGYAREEVFGGNILDYFTIGLKVAGGRKAVRAFSGPVRAQIIRRSFALDRSDKRAHHWLEWQESSTWCCSGHYRTKDGAERTCQRATDLERSNTDLQRFAYVASHDLKEPLRMVVSYLNLLNGRNKYELDSTSKEYIHFAMDGALRMRAMIDHLYPILRSGPRSCRSPSSTWRMFSLR